MDITETPPEVSVVIPTRNEEECLPHTVQSIRSGCTCPLQIIVVDAGSNDSTIEKAAGLGCTVLHQTGGRGSQLAAGAVAATGAYLWFVHADTLVPPKWEHQLLEPELQLAAYTLRLYGNGHGYWLVELGAWLRNHIFSGVPYGDQTLWIRRDLYDRIGGFPTLPLFEDVAICRAAEAMLGRVPVLPQTISTSGRKWDRDGVLTRTWRNWRLRLAYEAGVDPQKLAQQYT